MSAIPLVLLSSATGLVAFAGTVWLTWARIFKWGYSNNERRTDEPWLAKTPEDRAQIAAIGATIVASLLAPAIGLVVSLVAMALAWWGLS